MNRLPGVTYVGTLAAGSIFKVLDKDSEAVCNYEKG